MCVRLDPLPEDAYQEIWEKVFRALPGFDPKGSASVSTWVSRIAHHQLVDRHRSRRRRVEVELEESLPAPPRSQYTDLEAALKALPEANRRVVVLHHLYGFSLEEIAETEGIALGTIKSRLHRGRAFLAEFLK
jgi:RNA polymerase sigma-70 factor (ECF subfamily)